jgi:hypothetical protein
MVAFTAASVLTASALNSAFNAYTVNAQTGTTYTFVLTDQGGLVTASNASASTYTVPTNASVAYATGTRIELLNIGAGTVTLSPAGGVTLTGTTTVPQNARVVLVKQATNTWYSHAIGGGGLTLVATGTATAAASLSINNCFTSAFTNYRLVMAYTGSTATTLSMRLRVSGVDSSAASYNYASALVDTGGVTGNLLSATSQAQWMTNNSTASNVFSFDIFNPAVAVTTNMVGTYSYSSNACFAAFSHTVATAYDGITFTATSGTFTTPTNGIKIYGYSN